MVILKIKNHVLYIPTEWKELTPESFLTLAPLLAEFSAGKISEEDVKIKWLAATLETSEIKEEYKARFCHEIAFAMNQVSFFYKYNYGDALEAMDEQTRNILYKHHPDTLPDEPKIKFARRCGCKLEMDAYINRNLLPTIERNDKKITGWSAETITAGTFLSVLDLIPKLGLLPHLTVTITELLYPELKGEGKNLPSALHHAVLFNFQAFANYMFSKTRFSILFSHGETRKKEKLPMNIDQLYALSKKGYGSSVDIENITAIQYFTILMNELFEAVRTMKAYEKSTIEIADTLNLQIEEVLAI